MWVFVIAVIIIIARLIVISSDNDRPSNNNKPIIRFTESIEEKGTRGEREVSQIVAWSCYGSNAIPIKNLYLPWPDGSTAQIDELIIADSGIYVIEMKNYKGWIFGNENNKYWTQVLYSGYRGESTKNRLYNPIWQNASHVSCIRQNLKGYKGPIHSLIVFGNEAEFKDVTVLSPDVRVLYQRNLHRIICEIHAANEGRLSESDIEDIHSRLLNASSKADSTLHVENIHRRLAEKEERIKRGLCPRCGAPLVVRTAKKGPNAGSQFLGCSRYPDCKYTKNIN